MGIVRLIGRWTVTALVINVVEIFGVPAVPAFKKQLKKLETTTIRPAVKRYRNFLKTTYLPAARTSFDVSANPNGAAPVPRCGAC